MGSRWKSGGGERLTTTPCREPCVCVREGKDEASVAVRMGGAIEHRKIYCLECRGSANGRRRHLADRDGKERQGSTVSEEFMHVRKPNIGTWEVSIQPHGAAKERG